MRSLRGFSVLLIVCFSCGGLHADDWMTFHEYDSTLSWSLHVNQLIRTMVKTVTAFLKPVAGKITSGFGTRKHPILGMIRHHNGIDIACAAGSEVRAALAGKISFAGWKGGYGQLIEILHNGEISKSRYAHLSKILVKPGAVIEQGDLIGLSGQTGLASGPHLHFEVYQKDGPVDPQTLSF